MSVQDDIFDVAAALKRKPEAKLFDRLMTHFAIVEMERDRLREQVIVITAAARVIKELLGEDDR